MSLSAVYIPLTEEDSKFMRLRTILSFALARQMQTRLFAQGVRRTLNSAPLSIGADGIDDRAGNVTVKRREANEPCHGVAPELVHSR